MSSAQSYLRQFLQAQLKIKNLSDGSWEAYQSPEA
jgi:hypothetical protein